MEISGLTPLERAIRIAGSEAKLAAMIGVTQPAVNSAKRRGSVSAQMALTIDRELAPRVTKEELRPDLFPQPVEAA